MGVATAVTFGVVLTTPGDPVDRDGLAAALPARIPGLLLDRPPGPPDAPPYARDVPHAPPALADTRLTARPRVEEPAADT